MAGLKAAVLTLLFAAAVLADDRPPLAVVLQRVADYVVQYQKVISGVVAEEHYVQNADKSERPFVTHRELKSDLLLLRAEGKTNGYEQLRDVCDEIGLTTSRGVQQGAPIMRSVRSRSSSTQRRNLCVH